MSKIIDILTNARTTAELRGCYFSGMLQSVLKLEASTDHALLRRCEEAVDHALFSRRPGRPPMNDKEWQENFNYIKWQDKPGRTAGEILKLLNEAIALRRQTEQHKSRAAPAETVAA